MQNIAGDLDRLLIIDTCGERSSIALFQAGTLLATNLLQERTASASLLRATREVVTGSGLTFPELTCLGVVNGPGSFTGVRVGLAVVKGLCEAQRLPLAAASRLAVLADAAGLLSGFAVARASRGQLYARELAPGKAPREFSLRDDEFQAIAEGADIAYTEEALRPFLHGARHLRFVDLRAEHALRPLQNSRAEGGVDPALLDANYVRQEHSIYARHKSSAPTA